MQPVAFVDIVWSYYASLRRDLPWRVPEKDGTFDPYKILVSEIMLQQTQVNRVIAKYTAFLKLWPTVDALATASLADVLRAWSGLGYNRRAKFLWQAAQKIANEYNGHFPKTPKELTTLPGVGKNTAGAICAYAYNQPVVFIETNIRTVYIVNFFHDQAVVDDKEITRLLSQSIQLLGTDEYRDWYWALMDYGSYLKLASGNAARRSKHYVKQSSFQGSRRQLRGAIIKILAQQPTSLTQFKKTFPDHRLRQVLDDLVKEGLIINTDSHYQLP